MAVSSEESPPRLASRRSPDPNYVFPEIKNEAKVTSAKKWEKKENKKRADETERSIQSFRSEKKNAALSHANRGKKTIKKNKKGKKSGSVYRLQEVHSRKTLHSHSHLVYNITIIKKINNNNQMYVRLAPPTLQGGGAISSICIFYVWSGQGLFGPIKC